MTDFRDIRLFGVLGLVQFISSKTIAEIVSEYDFLLNYPRSYYLNERSVGPRVIDTYISKSCGTSLTLPPFNLCPAG